MSTQAALPESDQSTDTLVREIARAARAASYEMGLTDGPQRDAALRNAATVIRESTGTIISENEKDMAFAGEKGLNAAMKALHTKEET